jgi:signal transduction histidine kinase
VVRPSSAAVRDAAIAAVAFVVSLALLWHGGVDPTQPGAGRVDPLGVGLVIGMTAPLAVWRRAPLGVLAVTMSAAALLAGLGYPFDLVPGPTVALYLLAASRDRQHPWTPRTMAVVLGLLLAFVGAVTAAGGGFPITALSHTWLAWAVAWFAGERTRLRREHLADLEERVEHAERDAERERLLGVAEERARIARDLHDSAGHAISVIAVRAGAARLRQGQHPEGSSNTLAEIEELARKTAEEIDQIVGSLRDGQACEAVEAPVGLASLDTLVRQHAAAGLDVRLSTAGTPRALSAVADQTTYRILQEALTNASRHGAGGAQVELTYHDELVELTVTNPVRARVAPRSTGGHGLIGMQERATLLGGRLDAGRANGAFRVRARIPVTGRSA